MLQVAQPTPPTNEPWKQSLVKLDLTDVATPVLLAMTDPKDDAGDLYRLAVADYDAHMTKYKEMQSTRDFDESQVADLKAFDFICQAATSSSMHLFVTHPEEVVGYNTSVDTLDKLGDIVLAMANAASLAKFDKNYEVANKYANGLASLGYRLYKERCANIELDAGENYMGTGIRLLTDIAKAENASGKVQKLEAFDAKRKDEYSKIILPVIQVITSQGQIGIGKNAGDMFQIATDQNMDRVWRVEAIRRLGRLRFNAENMADQRKAPKVLGQIAADPKEDLVIKTAATKARDMTSYDNQGQR
jgi:hypothetical protein